MSFLSNRFIIDSQHSDQSGYDGGGSAMGASYLNNGGGQRHDVGDEDNIFMMFSPAEHADSMKRRKEKKRRERRAAVEQAKPGSRGSNSSAARPNASAPSTQATSQALRPGSITPTTHNIRDSEPANSAHYSPMAQSSSPRGATYESRQGPPSPVRPTEDDHYRSESKCNREYENNEIPADDDDVWYTKWWMFCFHTAIRNVNPKL